MQGRNANGSGDDPPRLVSCRRPSSTRTRDALLPKNTLPLTPCLAEYPWTLRSNVGEITRQAWPMPPGGLRVSISETACAHS
jgi:hypothetical protein